MHPNCIGAEDRVTIRPVENASAGYALKPRGRGTNRIEKGSLDDPHCEPL